MPKTTFDPDELEDRAGKVNKAAGRLDGIGSRVTSLANDLMGDPWAGGLASQLPGIFTDLPSIEADLHQTAKHITDTVGQYRDRQSGGPPSMSSWLSSTFGPAAPHLFQAGEKDLQSWWKKHGKDVQNAVKTDVNSIIPGVPLWNMAEDAGSWWQKNHMSALHNIALVSGLVAAGAGMVAALPIPGVDVVGGAVAEAAGVVNVGADVALEAYGDHSTATNVDLALAAGGLATGGVSRGLGKAAELAGNVSAAEKGVNDAAKAAESAKNAANEAAKSAEEASNAADTQDTIAKLSPGRNTLTQVLANKDAEVAASNAGTASQKVTEAGARLTEQNSVLARAQQAGSVGNQIKAGLKAATGVNVVGAFKTEVAAGHVLTEGSGTGVALANTGVVVANSIGAGDSAYTAASDIATPRPSGAP